jgi:hypothetical protein
MSYLDILMNVSLLILMGFAIIALTFTMILFYRDLRG